jgi:hypothetical protein
MAEKLFVCYRPCLGRTERKCVLADREGNLKDKRSVSPQLFSQVLLQRTTNAKHDSEVRWYL